MLDESKALLKAVREAAARRILFLPHAVNQMNAPDRMISTREVRSVIFEGMIAEDYLTIRADTVAWSWAQVMATDRSTSYVRRSQITRRSLPPACLIETSGRKIGELGGEKMQCLYCKGTLVRKSQWHSDPQRLSYDH